MILFLLLYYIIDTCLGHNSVIESDGSENNPLVILVAIQLFAASE